MSPVHPAVVHIPLGLAMVVPLLALGLTIALWRGRWPMTVWSILVALQLFVVGGGMLSMRSGDAEEHRVERFVSHDAVETHEGRAKKFMLGSGVVFLAALGVLLTRNKPALARGLMAVTTVGSLAVAAQGMRVGKAGGELIYVHGAAAAYTAPANAPAPGGAPVAHDQE